MRKRITQKVAENAKPSAKPYQIHDTLIPGFVLRVQPSGKKTWKLIVRRKPQTLGQYPAMTCAMAQEKAKRILTGDEVQLEPLTLDEFRIRYLDEWIDKNYARPYEAKSILRRFGFGSTRLDKILLADVERWRNRQTNKPSTINRSTATLKGALQKAVKWGLLEKNPLAGLEQLKLDRIAVARYLSPEEAVRLDKALAKAVPWLRPLVTVAVHTGCRKGELFQLKWGDITNGVLTVHGRGAKNGMTRHIPLNQTAQDALKAWRGDVIQMPGNPVFGKCWLERPWNKLMRDAEIEGFTFHCLRHTFASRLVMSGVALNTVRELLGHSDISMTLRYAHLAPETMKSAVELIG